MPDNINKKKGLGRGLSHLFGEAEAAYRGGEPQTAPSAAPSGLRTLPVTHLQPGKFQPRRHFDETALAELSDSIRVHGLLQPILIRPIGAGDRYEIVAGERRWRAAQRAGLHDVPVIVQALEDSQALEIALIENLQRQDLSALEEAEGYQRLIDEFQHSHTALGELVGKSRSHIANTLRLLGLPESVKRLVQEGKLSAGHARALLGAPNIDVLARLVVGRGLSVRQTEQLANQAKAPAKPAKGGKSARKDADLMALERDMSAQLGLKLSIDSRGKGGTVSIEYKTLDQLDEILMRLRGN